MPAENNADQGIATCREIAQAGRGKFYAVNDYKEIPRALIELLSQTWTSLRNKKFGPHKYIFNVILKKIPSSNKCMKMILDYFKN